MIVRKFTRDEWQQAFAVAFMLHPSADVALHVLIDASWIATLLEQAEARRRRSETHYKSPVPRAALLQFAVFCASVRWERDQESPLPKMEPRYKPTRDDLVVRYLKHLVCNQLLKTRLRYLAIALGCLLYDYKPKQITDFLGLYDEPKIRNIKGRMKKQLMKRFAYADVLTPTRKALRTKPASDHDRQLLNDALKLLTPWNTAHITVKPGEMRLAKMFAENSKLTNWDRKHLLLDPVCGGLEPLINEHNKLFQGALRLADPKLKLFVPDFDDTPTPPVDRFKAPRLTDGEITLLNERHKRIGPRTYDLNDLLSDLYEFGVDESIIEVLNDSASSTTESPPLRVLLHGSYAMKARIRRQFVEKEDDAMRMTWIVVGLGNPFGSTHLSVLSEVWGFSQPNIVSIMEPKPLLYRHINCCGDKEDILRHLIDVQIADKRLPYPSWTTRGVECSITGRDVFVEKCKQTIEDFIERSISDDLMKHGTIRYPFTNVWEGRHCVILGIHMVQDFFGWRWVDDSKPELSLESSWTTLSGADRRERSNEHKAFYAGHGLTIRRLPRLLARPAYREANEPRGYCPSLDCEDGPFETQSPIRLTLPTDGYLAVNAFHWMEQEQLNDLKPFVPKEELLVSDWYDGASTGRLQDGFVPYSFRSRSATRVKKTDARNSEAGPWGESSVPIWGIPMSANRASPETSTDAR
ncbi:MAG TPA: hypothetical protein VJ875_16255 [Pyrinomonadaceae bacterium]|nr:hypothetical protein [Pyrinomonadaceae bacterium]